MRAQLSLAGLLLAMLLAGVTAEVRAADPTAAATSFEPEVLSAAAALPQGSRLGALTLEQPRQILTMERLGREQNYLVALGNMAFSAPDLMGGVARAAGISCATCHSSGEINRAFFIPGLSAHPGSVDVTHRLFNHRAADGIANPLDIPSLRGLAVTAPYGRDGRFASLREFTRNVIVGEFEGAEPSPLVLDALVAYQLQFEFLENDRLGPAGRLADTADAAARRGEQLFRTPHAGMDGMSCASCHLPSAHFTDRQIHDIGTGGAFVTPTLLNANSTPPYFHDGRAADYAAVVEHFDTTFALGLSDNEEADLVAYLDAVGHGEEPFEPQDVAFDLREVLIFAGTLETSLADRDAAVVNLTVDTVSRELRDIRERWPAAADRSIRAVIADWTLAVRRIALDADSGDWAKAAEQLAAWQAKVAAERPFVAAAEPRSLYAPERHARHLGALAELAAMAEGELPSR